MIAWSILGGAGFFAWHALAAGGVLLLGLTIAIPALVRRMNYRNANLSKGR